MTTITLHGIVAKKFKKNHKFANISKPTDAFKAIDANNPGFMDFFKNSAKNNQHYEMIVNGNVIKNAQGATQKTEIKTIEIVPCVAGSDPVTALIVFAVTLVIGLVMAGIQYLMTPIPEEEPKNAVAQTSAKSFFFSNRLNVSKQFVPVPLGYGYLRVGSKIIESYIEPVDLNDKKSNREFNMNGGNPDYDDPNEVLGTSRVDSTYQILSEYGGIQAEFPNPNNPFYQMLQNMDTSTPYIN